MNKGSDINQLHANGDIVSINQLINLLTRHLPESYVSITNFESSTTIVTVSLSFVTWGGFPKDLFGYITSQIDKGRKLEIRIIHDGFGKESNYEFNYANNKWNFQEPCPNIQVIAHKATTYTDGANIVPFSYTNKEGKTRYAWMVSDFVEGVYRHGEDINATESAPFLDGLTPPDFDEYRSDDFIIKYLQAHGLIRFELGHYRTKLENFNAFLYIHSQKHLDTQYEPISRTLDEFLLRSPLFSETTSTILIETFGRDREDIGLLDGKYLVIGTDKQLRWIVEEHRFDEPQKSITQ